MKVLNKINEMREARKLSKISLAEIPQTVLLLVVGGLVLAFGSQIVGDVQGDMAAGSAEAAAVGNVSQGLTNLSLKMPSVGTIIGAVLIIGVLIGGFTGLFARR